MEINFSKPKKKFRKGGMHVTADTYWQILFVMGVFVAGLSLILGALLFLEMNRGFDISPSDILKTEQPISKSRIDKALQYFSEREMKSAEILNSPPVLIDP